MSKRAYDGTLGLPAFQRDWRWERSKVISLYDSLRKQFPIGSFLFVETSPEYNLSPRPYEGSPAKSSPLRLTLDGQQRITSGIVLIHGTIDTGSSRYFLDLKALNDRILAQHIDCRNEDQVKKFVQELDDQDNYMIATTRKTELNTLLLENHYLSSIYLADKVSIQKALEPYEAKYPKTKDLLKYVIVPYFTLENTSIHPVTTLTSAESLSAVTKIFATINTTGKQLTPIEIVTAILYSHDINLKPLVNEYREASEYLTNMDNDGEVLLQTIALLDGQTPKKSMLPKTITHERFKAFVEEALDLLDEVGKFLTSHLGVGLDYTPNLLPYISILAPMAVCFKEIKGLTGTTKGKAYDKMTKWFIGAAIGQRYIQGAGNKQETDAKDMRKWVKEDKDELKPLWLNSVHITETIVRAPPNGAIGNLLKCIINSRKPIDPLQSINVGYYQDAEETPEYHHIFPKKFCTGHIPDWGNDVDSTEYALNLIPVSCTTNKKWTKMNPKDQINDIKNTIPNSAKRKDIFDRLFLSDECVQILERTDKTKKDYYEFLEARFGLLYAELAKWDFSIGEQDYEKEETESDNP